MLLNHHITILVVDDDQDDCDLIKELIQQTAPHYSVTCVDTVDSAIIYLSSLHSEELPRLIVTDYYMPINTGMDLLKTLKGSEYLRHIPLVIYTHSFFPKYKTECLRAGASLYLPKSSSLAKCKEDIKQILDYCMCD